MPRLVAAANLTAASSASSWPVDFVKIVVDPDDSDKIVHLSNHFDPIIFGGDTYMATGQFLAYSSISDDLEAKNNSLTLTLSGVDSDATALILTNNIEGSLVRIYRGFFNQVTGALVATPDLRWAGRIDNYGIDDDHTFTDDDKIIISVNCRSLLGTIIDRVSGRYTNTSSITDKSMAFVAGLKHFNPEFGKE